MTGLDPNKDRLLEVACIVTDGQLKPLDEGVSYVIQTDLSVLANMDEWYVYTRLPQVCMCRISYDRLQPILKQVSCPNALIRPVHTLTPPCALRSSPTC